MIIKKVHFALEAAYIVYLYGSLSTRIKTSLSAKVALIT